MNDTVSTPNASGRRSRLLAIAAGLVALAVVAMLAGAGLFADEPPGASTTVPPLVIAAERVPRQGGYAAERAYIGAVEAARESRVGFELGGLVARVAVRAGAKVAAGDVLAELDTARLRARRAELTQALAGAESEANLAASTYARVAEAAAEEAASAQRRDEARETLSARRAQLRRIRAQIDSIDVDLRKARLVAPFDAIVVARHVDEGQVLQAGTPVLALLERAAPEVRIGLGDGAADRLRAGDRHTVRVAGRRFDARVDAVLPLRGARDRTVEAVLVLDATLGEGLRHGDIATLTLTQEVAEPGYWLPLAALTESARGLWAVYVAEPLEAAQDGYDAAADGASHRLGRRELEVLHERHGQVYVRGTLEDGARVVTGGVHRLAPGQRVRLAAAE